MKITEHLILKYYSGNCTEEERIFVESWILSSEDEPSELSENVLYEMDERTWKRIRQTLKIQLQKTDKKSSHLRTFSPLRPSWMVKVVEVFSVYRTLFRPSAAAFMIIGFLIVASATSLLLINPSDAKAKKTFTSWDDHLTKKSNRGERPTFALPDGSTVHLNSESLLKVPHRFSSTERIVYLEGHAHFDIVENPDKPFIIHTKYSKTQVLGTSFDVNTNRKTGETEVIVTKGKVAFTGKSDSSKKAILTVNNRAVLKSDQKINIDIVNAERLTAWKENRLVFDGETLAEIIEVLELWYDIQIMVEDAELLDEDFKLCRDNPPLPLLLEEMGFTAEFNYKIEGKKVIIFK